MSILTRIYGSTADCRGFSGANATYSTTRNSTAVTDSATSTTFVIGQSFSSPNYGVYQGFFQFDTSALSAGKSGSLSLNASAAASPAGSILEISETSALTNKIAGGSLSGLTQLASFATVGSTGRITTALSGTIPVSATLRYVVYGQNERNNVAPTTFETQTFNAADVTGTTNDPYLEILSGTAWDYVGVGTSVEATATSHVLTEPAGAASGDLLVACISSRIASTTSITLPSGWALVSEQKTSNTLTTSSAVASGMMAYIVRGGSAPSYTFTHPVAPSVALGRVVAYRNVNTSSPLDTQTSFTSPITTFNVSGTGLTTTQDDDLIVAMTAGGQEGTWSSFFASTDPATSSGSTSASVLDPIWGQWLERAEQVTTTGSDTGLAIFDAVKQTAGATGNLNANTVTSASHALIAGAFKLVPSGSPTYDEDQEETAAVAETVASLLDATRVVAETAAAAETQAGTLVTAKTIAETASAAETTDASVVPAGAIYDKDQVETAAAVETVGGQITFTRAVAETAAAADTVAGQFTFAGAIAESVSAAETVTGQFNTTKAVAETAAAVDTSAGSATFTGAVAETAAAAETLTGGLAVNVTVAETAAAADTVGKTLSYTSAVEETAGAATITGLGTSYTPGSDRNDFDGAVGVRLGIGGADIPINQIGVRTHAGATGTRTLQLYEWFSSTIQRTVTVDLTGHATDEYVWGEIAPITLTGGGYYGLVMEVSAGGPTWSNPGPTTFDASIVNIYDIYRVGAVGAALNTGTPNSQFVGLDLGSGSSGAGAVDTVGGLLVVIGAVAESASAVETVTGLRASTAAIAETESAAETITYSVIGAGGTTYNEAQVETAAAAETVANLMIFIGAIAETASAADTTTKAVSYTKVVAETATAAETVAKTIVFLGAIAESASAAETTNASVIPASVAYNLTVAETASAAETLAGTLVAATALAETAAAVETITKAVSYTKAIVETASAVDTVNRLVSVDLAIAETVAASETIATTLDATRAVAEIAAAIDAIDCVHVRPWRPDASPFAAWALDAPAPETWARAASASGAWTAQLLGLMERSTEVYDNPDVTIGTRRITEAGAIRILEGLAVQQWSNEPVRGNSWTRELV